MEGIVLEHCRTHILAGDIVTKPLGGNDLKKLGNLIYIVEE